MNLSADEFAATTITVSEPVLLDTFLLTAYCNCCVCCHPYDPGCTGNTSRTASGTVPKSNRTIAVDPAVIPFGTEVIINGQSYIAEDTGSAINGNRIDVFFDNHADACVFGKQYQDVYIVTDVTKTFIPVDFTEYMMMFNLFVSHDIAEARYHSGTEDISVINQKGNVLMIRTKNQFGFFEHRVEKEIYDAWKNRT